MKRVGLRYRCEDASREEIRDGLATLKDFKDRAGLFFSVIDEEPIAPDFVDDAMDALYE